MRRTLLFCLVTLSAFADHAGCGSPPTHLDSRDPVYADAMVVERTLTRGGWTVECVQPSVMANFFSAQKGAALFRTTDGDFEVLFLSKPHKFDSLEIVETRKGNRYIYSFRGRPEFEAHSDGAYPLYFARCSSKLFAAFNREVAAKLSAIFRCGLLP
jgi:hypothetical protein